MSVRYNDRTGMFEEVPSLSDRMGGIGQFLGRLASWLLKAIVWMLKVPLGVVFYPIVKWWAFVKESWIDGDRFLPCVMVFPGLILIGLYRLVFTVVFSAIGDSFSEAGTWDMLKVVFVIGGFVLFVVFYGRALAEARHGSLVVYRDWGDFAKSAVWTIAVPVGVAWTFEDHGDLLLRCAGLALLVLGIVSFCAMVSGAFRYNSGSERWLSLFARMGVSLMMMFALGRLQEKLNRYRRGELGVIRGALIPLAVFVWMFNSLIRPMIRTERGRW